MLNVLSKWNANFFQSFNVKFNLKKKHNFKTSITLSFVSQYLFTHILAQVLNLTLFLFFSQLHHILSRLILEWIYLFSTKNMCNRIHWFGDITENEKITLQNLIKIVHFCNNNNHMWQKCVLPKCEVTEENMLL
jgi:hypothetical protein